MGWQPMLGERQRWAVRNGIDKSGINKLGWNVLRPLSRQNYEIRLFFFSLRAWFPFDDPSTMR
jgi:hypothetical protein